jgi:transposase
LLHPRPESVVAQLFVSGGPFFFALDKVQVKYEMLRAHLVDGLPVVSAAGEHGYSRAAFYLVAEAFDEEGMAGLLDEKRGRRGPLKVTPEINEYVRSAQHLSGAELSRAVAERFGVVLHRRTLGALRRSVMRFWPATDRAQLDYVRLREMALAETDLIGPAASRFQHGGLLALIRRPSSTAPHLIAPLVEVPRPRWSPYLDPRLAVLADAYALLEVAARDSDQTLEVAQ